VLLDEPLSALDAHLRERLRVEIRALLKSTGVTAVYVTHDQDEAMALGDRIAVFNHGRIEQIGTPAEVYEAPASAFVAAFFGHVNQLGDLCFRRDQADVVDAGRGDFDATVVAATHMGSYAAIELRSGNGARITLHRFPASPAVSARVGPTAALGAFIHGEPGAFELPVEPGQSVGVRVLRRIHFGLPTT